MGGQENEILSPMILRFRQEHVEASMESFPPETVGAGIFLFLPASTAVLVGRGLQDQARIAGQGLPHLAPGER